MAVWAMGYAAHLAGVPRALDAVVTVLWVAGVTNAFNLLDNMDGLSAGVSVIAALSIFGVAWLQHRYLVAALGDRTCRVCRWVPQVQFSPRADLYGRRRQPVPGFHDFGAPAYTAGQCPDPCRGRRHPRCTWCRSIRHDLGNGFSC